MFIIDRYQSFPSAEIQKEVCAEVQRKCVQNWEFPVTHRQDFLGSPVKFLFNFEMGLPRDNIDVSTIQSKSNLQSGRMTSIMLPPGPGRSARPVNPLKNLFEGSQGESINSL